MVKMVDIRNMALNLLSQNPSISNNPNAQEFINVIRSGDSARGEQIAQNLCNTYGVSKEDAVKNAKSFFNLP